MKFCNQLLTEKQLVNLHPQEQYIGRDVHGEVVLDMVHGMWKD